MKVLLFYETAQVPMEKIMEIFPLHKSLVDEFVDNKRILGIGTYANPMEGSMAIFPDMESANEFIRLDPFVKEGIVARYSTKEWNDVLQK